MIELFINLIHSAEKDLNCNSELFSSIIENTITIIIALIAGIIALYQVKSNIVSSSRINWIESLRLSISEYYDAVLSTALYIENHLKSLEKSEKDILYDKYVQSHSRYFINSNKIRMYLNPKETDHKNLEEIMDKIDICFEKENVRQIDQDIIEIELKKMVNISRKIFKDEWTKSKRVFKI
jgi:hypothetical protein